MNSGTKVDSKDIIYATEMLMRQLLKLDSIEAEGEGKVQRKMEVGILKFNPFSFNNNYARVQRYISLIK